MNIYFFSLPYYFQRDIPISILYILMSKVKGKISKKGKINILVLWMNIVTSFLVLLLQYCAQSDFQNTAKLSLK